MGALEFEGEDQLPYSFVLVTKIRDESVYRNIENFFVVNLLFVVRASIDSDHVVRRLDRQV